MRIPNSNLGQSDRAFSDGLAPTKDGAALYYRDAGGPEPVVIFLHAHTGNALSWSAQWDAFIAAGYRPIAYSRRAYGNSRMNPDKDQGTYGGDLIELMNHLSIRHASLVAVAAGGIAALDAMLIDPTRFDAAFISSSLLGLEQTEIGKQIAANRVSGFAALSHAEQELSPAFRAQSGDAVAAWTATLPLSQPAGTLPRQPTKTRLTPQVIAGIATPIFLAAGDKDLFLPAPAFDMLVQASAPVGTHIFAGAAHAPHIECPQAFNRAALAFLAKMRA
jgi:pimeloyl-ACP methyl ester carboxylesterase